MSCEVPTTVEFPSALPARRADGGWAVTADGIDVALSNLDKPYWGPEGYTKADLVAYYYNAATWVLPYLRDRPLTMKRMPDGADADFFYAKQAPDHTPAWVTTAPVVSVDSGKRIDYVLAQETASLLWLANLGCIEVHPWHARVDRINRPDYAFFDLDPFDVGFATVREVALMVATALERLGLRGYPRTSGATGIQVFVPIDRVHSAGAVRRWVERVCRLIHRADPERTTMQWSISERSGKVYLDYGMNTEGKNIAAAYSLRPERAAPVATPLAWEELAGDVEPQDFTIATIWERLEEVGDLHAPVLAGGQDLREAMAAVGLDPDDDEPGSHRVEQPPSGGGRGRRRPAPEAAVGEVPRPEARDEAAVDEVPRPQTRGEVPRPEARDEAAVDEVPRPEARDEAAAGTLARYRQRRDFSRTPEPEPGEAAAGEAAAGQEPGSAAEGPRFVVQHHLATRLHHDLRLERAGTAPSWAVPKGLPDRAGLQHLAVRTEDHPLEYLDFSGDIPAGEYGAGPVRIWDSGTYELLEWREDKVSVRLRGQRHRGEFHLFRTDPEEPGQWMVVRVGEPEKVPPAPPDLRPMLASDGGSRGFDDADWTFEVKWDGVRAVATVARPGTGDPGSTRLVSRAGNELAAAYPELASLWERVLARNAVLDGEIVALDARGRPSFQRLQRRMHVRDAGGIERLRREVPVTFMVFDLLALDGESLTGQPLSERVARLADVLVPSDRFRLSEGVPERGTDLFEAAREHGLEGLIAKRLSSPYRPGKRSRDWLKLKVRQRLHCVVGGWMPGEGGRAGRLGSLLVGGYANGRLRYLGRVGTGFDEAELERLGGLLAARAADESPFAEGKPPARGARWVAPELVCRVEYAEVTEDGILRAPSYKGLEPDADPESCRVGALLERVGVAGG